jgi:hypothetical protein
MADQSLGEGVCGACLGPVIDAVVLDDVPTPRSPGPTAHDVATDLIAT